MSVWSWGSRDCAWFSLTPRPSSTPSSRSPRRKGGPTPWIYPSRYIKLASRYTKWRRLDPSAGFGLYDLAAMLLQLVVSFRHVEGALVTLAHRSDELRALCTCTSCLCAPLLLQTDMTVHRGAALHITLTCTSLKCARRARCTCHSILVLEEWLMSFCAEITNAAMEASIL